jgi:uncharacterized protein
MTKHSLPDRFASLLLVCLLAVTARGAFASVNDDLVIAVVNDRASQVRELLAKGADPNAIAPTGEPVLLIAARSGHVPTIEALLAGKANVNIRSKAGDSALMIAALTGHLEAAKKLRAGGAALDGPGWTPLIYASGGGHEALIRYLLDEGAKINAVAPNGTSALMMAVHEGKGPAFTLLLSRGADVNVRNQNDATALSWAIRGNEKDMAEALRRAGARE